MRVYSNVARRVFFLRWSHARLFPFAGCGFRGQLRVGCCRILEAVLGLGLGLLQGGIALGQCLHSHYQKVLSIIPITTAVTCQTPTPRAWIIM